MKRNLIITLAVISTFLFIDNSLDIMDSIGIVFSEKIHRFWTYYGGSLGIVFLISAFLYGLKNVLPSLGLDKGILKGMGYGLLFTLPMFLGYAAIGEMRTEWTWFTVLTIFIAAAMEEVVYRGFLFGQLFRKANWGFIPAVLLNALIFGSGHLYQGNSFGQTLGVFFVTLMGGIWFAWLYIEWENNLWIAIGLHVFMNLSWKLFAISDTALGGWGANLFRIITIALSIVFTIYYRKQRGGLRVNKKNLIFNNPTNTAQYINVDESSNRNPSTAVL